MENPLILASGSPRRKELLAMLGVPFLVDSSGDFTEFTGEQIQNPAELVLKNAEGKAHAALPKHPNARILGVDTVVFCANENTNANLLDGQKGKILEKPKDVEDAFRMLSLLQGRSHQVFTAQVLIDASGSLDAGTPLSPPRELHSVDQSTVTFLPMTPEQIRAYIATEEPMDKAGAYAAQGIGAQFIQKIDGDFFTVVGLSVSRFMQLHTELDQSGPSPVK